MFRFGKYQIRGRDEKTQANDSLETGCRHVIQIRSTGLGLDNEVAAVQNDAIGRRAEARPKTLNPPKREAIYRRISPVIGNVYDNA